MFCCSFACSATKQLEYHKLEKGSNISIQQH